MTDVRLLDEFPANYAAYARREHRWVRGDWQILAWLFPTVPAAGNSRRRNFLTAVERWKVFDNLRRSLVPPAMIALLVLGWTVLPGSAWVWDGFVLGVLSWPLLVQALGIPVQLLRCVWLQPRPRVIPENLGNTALQVLLAGVFLVAQAATMLDAVVRTMVRVFWTRRLMLQWETAASTERRVGADFLEFLRTMWFSPVLALVLGVCLAWIRPEILPAAAPFLAAWLVAPTLAWWVSRPRQVSDPELTRADRSYLRRLARKTWSFFETYVGAEDHWLPPDNYQEDPKGQVAHRTSPTNMGLYLLSSMSAYDFGYVTLPGLLDRLENPLRRSTSSNTVTSTFTTGTTPKPAAARPGYLSTVDSGNLLGCLIALKQGLSKRNTRPFPARPFAMA